MTEREQGSIRIGRATNALVRQNPLSQLRVVVCSNRRNLRSGAPGRLRIGVGIECRLSERAHGSGPPPDADTLVRVGLARDIVGTIGHATGMHWRATPRESRACEIEAAPPQMRRT